MIKSDKITNLIRKIQSEAGDDREKKTSITAAVIFVVLLIVVFTSNLFIADKKFSPSENRMLQELPAFSLSDYLEGRYEKKFENYTNDQFLLRGGWIKLKSATDITAGKLEANGVYRSRNGYLIEELSVPDSKQLKATEKALKEFRTKHSNLPMTFLLAPNAGNIMKEKLPISVHFTDQNPYMDNFYGELKKSGFKTVDVRKSFQKQKKKVQLYYRTDHHWTTDGAYLAYQQLIPQLGMGKALDCKPYAVKKDFAGTLYSKSGFTGGRYDSINIYEPRDKKQYKDSVIYYGDTKEKTTEFYQLDNLNKKDAYTVFGGNNHPMYTVQTPTKSDERLLLFKDSYANSIIPLLAQHFREIVVVDPRYYFDDIEDLIEVEGITQVLFLYNANTFFTDDSLEMILTGE